MKKNRKITRFLFLVSLAITTILTACPSADSGGGGAFNFTGLGLNKIDKEIWVFFDKDISSEEGALDASRITVKKGSDTLKREDYTLEVIKYVLLIKLTSLDETAEYTVELQTGAIKDAKGNTNAANSGTLDAKGTEPEIDDKRLPSRYIYSGKVKLTFRKDLEIVDARKIKVEVKSGGDFKKAEEATFKVHEDKDIYENVHKIMLFTLGTATSTNIFDYRFTMEPGAIRDAASKQVNTISIRFPFEGLRMVPE